MKLVTSKQIQEIDSIAIQKYRISSLTLMENAGSSVARIILEQVQPKGPLLVVVGKGNNGGDGLVVARFLLEAGLEVEIALFGDPKTFSKDSQTNWQKLKELDPNIVTIYDDSNLDKFSEVLRRAKYVVDAIFGTGLSNEVRGKYAKVIDKINAHVAPVIAIDIPSGLSADTGQPLGTAIYARLTVTFGLPKLGHVLPPAPEHVKELHVADIGFPQDLLSAYKTATHIITPDLFKDYFISRSEDAHKGDFGHVLVLAGSTGKMGAGWLTSKAALRSGAGLVTFGMPSTAFERFDNRFAEVMVEPIEDRKSGHFVADSLANIKTLCQKKSVVAFGPGIGTHRNTAEATVAIASKLNIPLVIDADALNNISGNLKMLQRRLKETVLTPHPGEMSKLTKLDTKSILKNRVDVVRSFSVSNKIFTVLKGNRTLVGTPKGRIFVNTTGNPGMATAGMGDALTGMIAAFIARKMPTLEAVLAAVYIHGLAGDLTSSKKGEVGMITSDLIENIPEVINIIKQWKPAERII
jgi:NAD(P)H-hydrate epimerase